MGSEMCIRDSFAIILAISGAIYLFNPQYQSVLESSIHSRGTTIEQDATQLSAERVVEAALSQHPSTRLRRLTLPRSDEDRSYEVELITSEGSRIVWVDQYSGDILHDVLKSDRLMEIVKDIHEGLLVGNKGSYVVELMASWMIVLIITGFYLWWPRGRSLASFFIPRLSGQSNREKLKQIHGVGGAWVGGMVLLLLLSGLPWTQLWGAGFERVTKQLGWDAPAQEWVITLESNDPHAEHKEHSLSLQEGVSDNATQATLQSMPVAQDAVPISITTIVATARDLELGSPIEIQPPAGKNGVWTIKSMMQNRPKRTTVHLDRWTGEEIMRIGFKDRHAVQQLTGYGIALHEGALFGWFNQLLGLVAALGVVALSITGTWMWWRRRPKGAIGMPSMPEDKRIRTSVILLIAGLALFLPMVLISLIAALIIDVTWSKLKPAH